MQIPFGIPVKSFTLYYNIKENGLQEKKGEFSFALYIKSKKNTGLPPVKNHKNRRKSRFCEKALAYDCIFWYTYIL